MQPERIAAVARRWLQAVFLERKRATPNLNVRCSGPRGVVFRRSFLLELTGREDHWVIAANECSSLSDLEQELGILYVDQINASHLRWK